MLVKVGMCQVLGPECDVDSLSVLMLAVWWSLVPSKGRSRSEIDQQMESFESKI